MVQLQRVRPDRAPSRGLIALAVVGLVAIGGFIAGRQSWTPAVTTAPEASTGASALTPTVTAAALATPLVRPAVVPADLASMVESVLAQGSWAVCEARGAICCERLPRIELTASEAVEARTAWPRLTPVTSSPGEVVVAAPSTALDYALFVSLDPGTRPTLVDPAITVTGIAFLDLGPYLPAGRDHSHL